MVPKRLKAAREAAGLSQSKLAELIGIEGVSLNSRLSNYESGRFTPSFDVIVRVAKVLDYPEGYFYTLDDAAAEAILLFHQNRNNKSLNPYYDAQAEAKKYRASLEEARKTIERLLDVISKSLD
ncbi:transcriptional regulator [Enterobacterales bacterium CwR94]|nr:transcriptional regulator [Enterobacterales bacterium CwR94]